jgi:preprotein translocase subunit SecD
MAILFQGGFTSWRQGLDLAGGVRLLYLMDFSQYKQNYQNEAEFNQQKNRVVNIVEKNIDSRISKL